MVIVTGPSLSRKRGSSSALTKLDRGSSLTEPKTTAKQRPAPTPPLPRQLPQLLLLLRGSPVLNLLSTSAAAAFVNLASLGRRGNDAGSDTGNDAGNDNHGKRSGTAAAEGPQEVRDRAAAAATETEAEGRAMRSSKSGSVLVDLGGVSGATTASAGGGGVQNLLFSVGSSGGASPSVLGCLYDLARTTSTCRIGNCKVSFNQRSSFTSLIVICVGLMALTFLMLVRSPGDGSQVPYGAGGGDHVPRKGQSAAKNRGAEEESSLQFHSDVSAGRRRATEADDLDANVFDASYPLTQPLGIGQGVLRYRVAAIADMDTQSLAQGESGVWRSFYKRGFLTFDRSNDKVDFEWNDEQEVVGSLSYGGRGMELSELTVFNGNLLTFDDRTGVVYKLLLGNESSVVKVVPWVILADGDGNEAKGFKCEWATVKDKHLYVGGIGKEWTTPDGEIINFNPMFVKRISAKGHVEHLNWYEQYVRVRDAAGIQYPGYMIHEAVVWSDVHKEWFFLPRRASKSKYNEVTDETKGTNLLLRMRTSDEGAVGEVKVSRVGELGEPASHGFSSFKFLPGTGDSIAVALKTEELDGKVASYVMAFRVDDGAVLYPETKIGDVKFEGLEFV